MMASAKRVSREAFEDLCRMIQHWNENRLELFEISMPNENLEFEGIMRFYFQNDNPKAAETEKVATKCIRVSNSATTESVIKSLIQKFRPDMKMLTSSSYALYEVHANQDERKLESNEIPLLVQLGWSRGDRDGRFLLRSESDHKSSQKKAQKKRLSKRAKKSKKEKPEPEAGKDEEDGGNGSGRIARSLYNIMPESRFTRSISIKNRRNLLSKHTHDKLQKKDNVGNEFRVHTDFVLPDAPPSITVLINERDTAAQVVKTTLDKYGIRDDATKFCLVQTTVPSFGSEPHLNVDFTERVLGDNEHPSQVYQEWASGAARGTSTQFQLRRRSTVPRNQRESRSRSLSPEDDPSVPALVEIFQGAQSPPQSPRRFELSLEMTEIGSNVALLNAKSYICLTSSGIKPRHCVISSVNGIFTISPLDKTASIYVNSKFIKQPEFLPHNAEVKLGDREMFRFFAPVESKLFTSSMHTLPSTANRPGSSRGMTSPTRTERKSSLPRSENISKAYSVEDFCSPGFTSNRLVDGRLKDRAFSEHNLKVDDRSSSGYGSGRVQRKFSEPNFMAEDGPYLAEDRSKHGGSDSQFGTFPSSNKKKRHMTPAGDKGHLDEGVELEWVLPASLSFYQPQESLLLQMMISEVNGYLLTFKLAPACSLYMVLKHHLSPDFQPAISSDRRKCLSLTIKNIFVQFKKSIKESRNVAGVLAFWLANSSEFLHLVTRDPQLKAYSAELETPLSQIIHTVLKYFISCMTRELGLFLPALYDESSEADSEEAYISGGESTTSGGAGKDSDMTLSRQTSITGMYWSVAGSKIRRRGRPTLGDVLTTLSSTISLLRHCRVNATFSVMIFSHLFRYMSAKLVNKLFTESKLCTRATAGKMSRRLDRVKEWSEKEGMDLPAEDHLSLVTQALSLLQSVKKLPEDAQHVHMTCSNLNSLQVQTLLGHCSVSDTEQTINPTFAEQLIVFAETRTDELLRRNGIEPAVEEDPNLELPFLIPQQKYFTDSLKGIPSGFHDYLEPMISSGLCKLTIAKDENPQGIWVPPEREKMISPAYSGSMSNIHTLSTHPLSPTKAPPPLNFPSANRLAPVPQSLQDIVVTQVNIKKEKDSLGISIIGGKNSAMHGDIGIFVKSMVEGGTAHLDGRIQPGDQILAVDNFSLEGCKQEEAAHILRSTGLVVNLTVAKQTAPLYGLSHLIGQPSPRYGRKFDRAAEATARKALKKQRREQRERQHQERQQQQQRDFRLERRKPSTDRQHHGRAQDFYPGPTHGHLPTEQQRLPPHSNPQFAKWIMEQNPRYYSELGSRTSSELDLESSVSSLANIPERDHPANTSELSFLESNRYNYEAGDRTRELYRTGTPPVRDSSPTKMPEPRSTASYMQFGSSVTSDSRPASEEANKLTKLMRMDQENRLPPTSKPRPSYRDEFSSVSSQITMGSQSMLTPFSQQISSQQQLQHLDKLSMDVMQHTQLSGTSFQGITSLIPKSSHQQQGGPSGGEVPLNRKGLKGFEMDDIALEKQRIQLMFFEEQKQKERLEKEQLAKALNPQVASHLVDSEEDDDDINDEPLSQEQLKQELESLDEMVFEQRKKYREIKFSREREELKLKDLETKFREQEMKAGAMVFNSSDPKRWQSDQKRLLRELERVTNEQREAIHKIQSSERRAKTRLKACEAQASEIRQQLHLSTPPAPSPNLQHKTGYESYDTVPSKLTSEYSKKGPISSKAYSEMNANSSRDRSTVSESKWSDVPTGMMTFGGAPARAVSIESMSVFEPPDLAREPMNTISASCLTEPTQDEPRASHWPSYRPNTRETADSFGLERNDRSGNLTNGFKAISMDNVQGSQSVPVSEGQDSHSRTERVPLRREQVFDVQPIQTAAGRERKETHGEGRRSPTKAPIYAIPEFSEVPQPTYDVPTSARPAHQQTTFMHAQPTTTQTTGRHYSRNSRSRGVQYTKVFLQPTANRFTDSIPSPVESPKRDVPQNEIGESPIPMSHTVPLSPHAPINQRQVTGSERNQSPNNRGSPLVPSPQPSDSHYSVPIPAQIDRITPSPTAQGMARAHGTELTRNQQYHVSGLAQNSRSVVESGNGTNSPTLYDQPKPQSIPPAHTSSTLSSRPTQPAMYDVPSAARKLPQRSPYEGVGVRQADVPTSRGINPAPKPNSGHRYGIVKPGMGHSYSRSRPDPMQQQPVGLDKVKGLMDRTYKNQGGRRPPERVQRHQTEL